MLYISPYEMLIVVGVLIFITVGPPVAAYVAGVWRRWKERRRPRQP